MNTMTYRYTGPNSAVTLVVADDDGTTRDQDVLLWHNRDVALPADHDVVQTMVERGLLKPVAAAEVGRAE